MDIDLEKDFENEQQKWSSIMSFLSDLGYDRIVIEYSGSGDSCDIDLVDFIKSDSELSRGKFTLDDKYEEIGESVTDFIREFASARLDHVEDWWNNDGGYGTMTIQVPSGEYLISNNQETRDYENFVHNDQINMEV